MKYIDWDPGKNELLIRSRGISFERVVVAINSGNALDVVPHPNQQRYPNQLILVVLIEEYVYLVPLVNDERKIFLKTIIPSRKATKNYRKERKPNEQATRT